MCIAIVCFLGFDVINFEINLNFLMKPFLYMTKKSGQKFKYLEIEKSFCDNSKCGFSKDCNENLIKLYLGSKDADINTKFQPCSFL